MERYWIELQVVVSRDDAEAWADACLEAGAASVQAEDADADSPDEQPLFAEPDPVAVAVVPFGWQATRLAILLDPGSRTDPSPDSDPVASPANLADPVDFADPADRVDPAAPGGDTAVPRDDLVDPLRAVALLAAAAALRDRPPPPLLATRRVGDRDWVRATQSQFAPIPIGARLVVVPSWHRDAVVAGPGGRTALTIDPGLAFGTGGHATTRMCLEWLEQAPLSGRRVIDYGCGSGILAIAAMRLGAAAAIGIDIDPQALRSAVDNAAINQVVIGVQDSHEPLPPPADVVVANILSNPLKLLAPLLCGLVAPGGMLVLSGVLERQVDEVAASYPAAFDVGCWRRSDGWACLIGRRPDDLR